MRLKLLHRTALYAGALSLLACLLVSLVAVLAFDWQERTLLESALQAGINEMYGHIEAGGWPDLHNAKGVVSAVSHRDDLRSVPAALRELPVGQTELEVGDYAQFIVLVRQIENYRYYYGLSIAHSEQGEANFAWIILILVFSAVIISALMGWLFAQQLVRPLTAVARAIGDIDQSSKNLPLERQNQDEIDQIVLAVNSYQIRLNEAAARETAFLADVAHALRTPAAVIQSGLELLSRETGARDLNAVTCIQRDSVVLERVARNSQQLVLKLDALMLSARKQEVDGHERLALASEVEYAMRYLSARGSTSFVIEIGSDVFVQARVAVLRWVISQCASSFSAHQIVEITWRDGALSFLGKDAVSVNFVLPELIQVVCARERWPLNCGPSSIRIALC